MNSMGNPNLKVKGFDFFKKKLRQNMLDRGSKYIRMMIHVLCIIIIYRELHEVMKYIRTCFYLLLSYYYLIS